MRWLDFDKGCSRMVVLIGGFAIKLPNLTYKYPACLWGLIHNLNERCWWRAACGWLDDDDSPEELLKPLLCPVVWGDRLGLILIMRRAAPLPRSYDCPVFFQWLASRFERAGCECPAELKRESFGIIGGAIVAIDYA